MSLIIDSREPKNIIEKLKSKEHLGAKTSFLESGDYLLPDGYSIERKKGRDLLSSVMSNRLYEQLNSLCQYENPILAIITHNKYEDFYYTKSKYIHNQYIGTIVTLTTSYPKLRVRWFDSDKEFIEFVDRLYRKLTEKGISSRPKPVFRKVKSDNEIMENMLTAIKGISVNLSKKILKHYGSVNSVVNADVKQHQEIEKVGKKLADDIYRICNNGYHKNNNKK